MDLMVFCSSCFTEKDRNLWVFGALRGQKYADNSKYLFEYVNRHTDIQAIWISKNPAVVKEIRARGYSAYAEDSQQALYYAKRAKVAVITHRGSRQKSDLPFQAFSSATQIVQLWHGIPLKKIAYDDTLFSFTHNEGGRLWQLRSFIKMKLFPFLNYVNEPSTIPALSDETREIFAKAFRIPQKNVVVTGYPRNDTLLTQQSAESGDTVRRVIYMPTFRGSEHSNFDPFAQGHFDAETLDSFLGRSGMVLDIKLHAFNQPTEQSLQKISEANNLALLEHDDIYELLANYDLLITDYSSIFFDYLLLNRPIIFAPFDYDEYVGRDRSFYFDYLEVTPGPKVMNWRELQDQLAAFRDDAKLYSNERLAIRDRFHFFQDNQSAKRLYQLIATLANRD